MKEFIMRKYKKMKYLKLKKYLKKKKTFLEYYIIQHTLKEMYMIRMENHMMMV